MPDATRLPQLRRGKKKVDGFIIPANYFYGRVLEIDVKLPEIVEVPTAPQLNQQPSQQSEPAPVVQATPPEAPSVNGIKVSALSLASIRAKRELAESHKATSKEEVHLPTEAFTETDMLLQWNKFAQRLSDRGHKIMESLLLINDPKLEGTTIVHELPNEGSKIEFESGKHELVGYLRGKLHNHDIEIKVVVNENIDARKAFTPQDRFNRLNEINPTLELLRKTFDLDI
ncbi:MAG TPA: DNA polymerase III subunit gamma/tau [Flavobacterium sp.]|jgi:hypothetical protein